ncbi:MAG: nickel pincer cofactor biosynthesis protein LarC [Deltaproteobacteria bacterium]|nr:nickel pincer cofactor biosynthesis protein LarC [Deltaproteobacteria bacterium]
MARTLLHFDPAAGASGDMVLGALLDVGVPAEVVDTAVRAVGVMARLEVNPELRHGIRGLKVRFLAPSGAAVDPLDSDHPPELIPPLMVDRRAGTAGPLWRHVEQKTAHTHAHHPWREVAKRISAAPLATDVRDLALRFLGRLAAAEAQVHGIPLDDVALHEVAADDSVADLVGAAAALCHLAPDRVTCDAFGVCSGFIRMEHGNIPGPGPATAQLLMGAPVVGLAGRMETVTPTGAAILTTVAHSFGPPPAMVLVAQGFGAGRKDPPERANLLRAWLGEEGRAAHRVPPGDAVLLETNVDDMTPQDLAVTAERLLAAGALDAWVTPVVMKKGRAAWTLHALVEPSRQAAVVRRLFQDTTTLGVRIQPATRMVAERVHERVRTPWGDVRVKVARVDGVETAAVPEFDDCARLAARAGVAVGQVRNAALTARAPAARRRAPRRSRR